MNKHELIRHARLRGQIEDPLEALRCRCRGWRVLDVGCVGQARKQGTDGWLHGQLAEVASSIDGVDIDDDGLRDLRDKGFSAIQPTEVRLRRYDRIVMGDVVEHVDSPVEFLRFYSACLAPAGQILITTPNASNLTSTLLVLARNGLFVNDEHTCWFDPATLCEVGRRAGLEAVDFVWLRNRPGRRTWRDQVLHASTRLGQTIRPHWSDSFLLVLRQAGA